MKGIQTSAGSASRSDNEFRVGGGAREDIRRTLLFVLLRDLSVSCSGVLSSSGDAIECSCLCVVRGSVAPLGLGDHGGTEPSAHALGYHLTALRAWGHGSAGREAAEVCSDRTGVFPVSFRYRCRFRSRYRRVGRGVAGRVARTQGACLVGMLRRAKESLAKEVGRTREGAFVLRFPFLAA